MGDPTFVAKPISARLQISGNFECRDKDGKLLKTFELWGSLPISDEPPVPQSPSPPISSTANETPLPTLEQENGDQRSE